MIGARRLPGVLLAAGLLAVLLSGCNDKNPVATPAGKVKVVTDASTYVQGTPVNSLLVNGSDQTVYTLSCTAYTTLEVLKADGWSSLGSWYLVCDGPTRPVPLAPGNYFRSPPLTTSGSMPLDPGTYRIRVDVFGNDTFPYKLIPEDQRLSEPFEITVGGSAAPSR